jgi:hypothetical protein
MADGSPSNVTGSEDLNCRITGTSPVQSSSGFLTPDSKSRTRRLEIQIDEYAVSQDLTPKLSLFVDG